MEDLNKRFIVNLLSFFTFYGLVNLVGWFITTYVYSTIPQAQNYTVFGKFFSITGTVIIFIFVFTYIHTIIENVLNYFLSKKD